VSRSGAAWQGRVSEDAWLSTFASPKSVLELQCWDKTKYQFGFHKIGEKKGVKSAIKPSRDYSIKSLLPFNERRLVFM
jgi:hypothetical protein